MMFWNPVVLLRTINNYLVLIKILKHTGKRKNSQQEFRDTSMFLLSRVSVIVRVTDFYTTKDKVVDHESMNKE